MSTSQTESDFLDISAALTGFERVELEGTGLSDTYYREVNRIVGGRIFGRLLLTWREVAEESQGDESKLSKAIKQNILKSSLLGDIARNIISLWYVGNWVQLPGEWRNKYGATAGDVTHVVSAVAFQEGLAWRAIEAHPPTARSPGFGTWAYPLKDAEPLDNTDEEYFLAQGIVPAAHWRQKSTGKKKTAKR